MMQYFIPYESCQSHVATSNLLVQLLTSGKCFLKFEFTASFQACILSEKFEILKYKIDHEIITQINFYYTIHYAVSIYEHFPLKNSIFQT